MHPSTPSTIVRCGARARTKDGAPCSNPVMRGAVRCRMHGAATGRSREAAAEKLLRLTDPALAVVRESLRRETDPHVRLRAALTVLDRCGLRDAVGDPDAVPRLQVETLVRKLTAAFLDVVEDPELRRRFARRVRQLSVGARLDVPGPETLDVEAVPEAVEVPEVLAATVPTLEPATGTGTGPGPGPGPGENPSVLPRWPEALGALRWPGEAERPGPGR